MDPLGAMKIFVRVIETGSFSAAAKDLRVGQSAVSKSIARLEERLGVRLLLRSIHGVTATEAGQTYYTCARRTIDDVEEAELAVRKAGASLTGRLRVSAGVTFAGLYLVPRLSRFLAQHPDLTVEFVLDDRPVDLIEEGVDIGLRYGPLADASLTGRKIASTRRVVVSTPSYLDRAGLPKTPSELLRHEIVIYSRDRDGGDTWVFRKDDSEISVTLRGRVRLTSSEGVRAAVLSGLGMAVVSQWLFKPELDCGKVRQVLTDWALPDIELWLVFPMGRMANAKARAFETFVQKEIAVDIMLTREEIGRPTGRIKRKNIVPSRMGGTC